MKLKGVGSPSALYKVTQTLPRCFLFLQEYLSLLLNTLIFGYSIVLPVGAVRPPAFFVEFLQPNCEILGSCDDLRELITHQFQLFSQLLDRGRFSELYRLYKSILKL